MKGEARVGLEVGVPVAAARQAGDVDPPIKVVEPDLEPAGLAALPAGRGDVDGQVALESAADPLFHGNAPYAGENEPAELHIPGNPGSAAILAASGRGRQD